MKNNIVERIAFACYDGIIIPLLWFYFFVAQWFVPKIREGKLSRRHLWEELLNWKNTVAQGKNIILFHCSSLGEVEQAKPLVESIKAEKNDTAIIVSFYSPSGYDFYKSKDPADLKVYLPFDSRWQAKMFFEMLNVSLWIIVKHDIWPNHMRYAKKCGVPMILIDANLPPHSRRLLPLVRQFYRLCFRWFAFVLPVSDEDAQRFALLYPYPDKIIVAGDTRYDQVIRRSKEVQQKNLEGFDIKSGSAVLVCGSVWQSDTAMLIPALPEIMSKVPDLQIIMIPHEPVENYLKQLEEEFGSIKLGCIRYSALKNLSAGRIIIVDRIGILAHVYKYATVCYVGGSCGPGVHNVMEPAILGKPVLFGPRYENSFEAIELARKGGGFPVGSAGEFEERVTSLLINRNETAEIGKRAAQIIRDHAGATERIMKAIKPVLP